MSTVAAYEGLEAAEWAWRAIWSPGQKDKFASMRILESVVIGDQGISKWLFTSVNNHVKSRKKGSWTLPALMETCQDPGNVRGKSTGDVANIIQLQAHYLTPAQSAKKAKDGRAIPAKPAQWLTLESGECGRIIGGSIAAHAIVSFAHIPGPISFAEVTIEMKVDSKEVNPTPKIVTQMLYSGSRIDVSGSALTVNEKLEREEQLNKLGLPPQKLTCLNRTVTSATTKYISTMKKELESRSSTKIRRLTAVVLLETTADEEKAAWLHHVKYVDFMPKMDSEKSPADEEWQERRSNAASEISSGSNSWHRIAKCMGDFCQYPLDEEEAHDMMDNADTNGNFKLELQKARARHRKDDGTVRPTSDTGDMLSSDNRRADDGAPLPDEGEQKKLGRKVPFKSIALCRQDSESWEITGRTHVFDSTTMPWPETLYTWWFRVGKGLATNGSGAGVPVSGAHSIGKAMLGMNPIPEADGDGPGGLDPSNSPLKHVSPDGKKPVSLSELSAPIGAHQVSKDLHGEAVYDIAAGKTLPGKEIQYDLQENKYSGHKRRSIGQMSWYYSEANVCQTCYYTYRDIDRRRGAMQTKSLKAMRKHMALTTGKSGAEYDKEIEKKIFAQRKMASRLAAPRQNPSIDSSSEMLRSGTSPSLHSSAFRGGKAKAPKGALPPLPWQLRDEEAAREYMEPNKFNSAIVRNIRGKAQGMAQLVQQDRMIEKVEAKKKRMMRGGMLDDNSQLLDEATVSAEAEWQEFIGQSRADFEQKKAAMKAVRKVTGGLGENRPKPKSKNFDPTRLKHQWQRDADVLAKKVRDFEGGTSGEDDPGYTGLGEPIKPASLKANDSWNRGSKRKGKENKPAQSKISMDDPLAYGSLAQGSLAQGSMVSQLTMEPSMAALGNNTGPGIGQNSLSSLDGLDDEDWIRAVMVSGKGSNVNLAELSYSSNRSGAKTPNKRNMNVSFQDNVRGQATNAAAAPKYTPSNALDDDDDDDDDDEGVGWSPFVIPGGV